MIFFKLIIFIFFFLVSNNLFASTSTNSPPDCADGRFSAPTPDNINNKQNVSRPGDNCNFSIDNEKMEPCTLGGNNESRINCMNLADLPSCLTFEEPNRRHLRNCIRVGDGKTIPSGDHDICEIDPNDPPRYAGGKQLGINCVNLCYTNDPSDGPENCVERKYHHYLYKQTDNNDPGNLSYLNDRINLRDASKRDQLQYSCRKLTAGELKYFSDEFSTINCATLREINSNGLLQISAKGQEISSGLTVATSNSPEELHRPGETCRYPKCDSKFGIDIIPGDKITEQIEENNSIQISQDIESNDVYTKLQNCSNNPDHSFIAEDRIVCKNDRKCYNFTSSQINPLISSPNAVEKCLAKSKNTESIAKCFLSLEPLKMCRLHSTIGPDCANICSNAAGEIPGINCFNNSNKPKPMINCNYHSVIDGANYIDDSSIEWTSSELDSYKSKFLTAPDPAGVVGNSISINYAALEYANLAFNSQDQSPDYFKHDICNDQTVINECATDCNYIADPNSQIAKACLERLKPKSVIIGDPIPNPLLDESNQEISYDIHNDADNDWFYRPYPLVDRCYKDKDGDCLDGNRQFRNVVKWSNIPWGSNYNGSLFVFDGVSPNDSDVKITPRQGVLDKYQREFDNNEIARGAYFHRLCVNWTNMIDLDILDYGEIVAKTAAITAAASVVSAPFFFIGGPIAVAAVFAITYDRLINEVNLDKFISPKQCFAPRINVRTNHLGSSAISGYSGSDADDNDKAHYQFQYDEINLIDEFIKAISEKYPSIKSDPIITGNDRFKIEFSSDNDFNQDIVEDDRLKKVVLIKDGYIKGDVVHDYSNKNSNQYRIRACMRFDGGARSCNVSCNLLGFCHKQNCGYDQCVDLYVNDSEDQSQYQCSAAIKDGNVWRRKTDDEFRFPEDNYEGEDPNYPGLMKNEEKFCAKEITSREIVTGQSGIIRLRAVAYPDRHICVFADAAHGNGESDDGNEIWRVRGLIPVVSIPYKGLSNLDSGLNSLHPRQFCLRYGTHIDTVSYQIKNDCNKDVEARCEPFLHAASDKKENIDNFYSTNNPLEDSQKLRHKEHKAEIFNNFKENLSITSISNQYSKPVDNIYETDFFNPAILVNYGSELAITSLPTGCIGGYKKFNDQQITNTPPNPSTPVPYSTQRGRGGYSGNTPPNPSTPVPYRTQRGRGGYSGSTLPSSSSTTTSNVFTITNYSKCQHSSYTSDINFPDDTFSHMLFSENRKNIKKSTDGVLQLSANQYSDLTGLNYEKILYLKKGFSQGRPSVGLYKYNGSNTDYFLNQFTIYRKLPNYDNINLNYDETSGKFSIQLQNKKESDYATRLPAVELDIDPSDPNSNINSLISGEKCFDLSNDDNKAKLEYMKFCLKPDECSNLFDICIANNLFSSATKGNLWNKCFGDDNNSLINKCSAKWGLSPSTDIDVKRDIMQNMIGKIELYRSLDYSEDLYGWNHEVCLDPKSYNQVKVAAYNVGNNMGKCILDPVLHGNAQIDDNNTPDNILDDTISTTNGDFNYNNDFNHNGKNNKCNHGGDESKDCHCLKLTTAGSDYNLGLKKLNFLLDNNHITTTAPTSTAQSKEYYLRDATPRELGLCFDKELPLECASNEVKPPNNYISRTKLVNTYHAEYGHIFIPYSEFETGSIAKGECKANWKVQEGVPMMRCVKDGDGATFKDVMLKINFNPPITISVDTTIINLLDGNGRKRPELRDVELDMLFPNHILNHKITLNPDSDEKEEVPIHNRINGGQDIDLTNDSSFAIDNSNITVTTIINSIAINYSLQGRCVRPKCITGVGSIPTYQPTYSINPDAPEGGFYVGDDYYGNALADEQNLPLKGSKSGYAYWHKDHLNVDAKDINQTIKASNCFDGFVESSSGSRPELQCSPEGVLDIISDSTTKEVINECERKTCDFRNFDFDIIKRNNGVNFEGFDLTSNPLNSSRSTNQFKFDFSVTYKGERSSVTSECNKNLFEGRSYVKSAINAPDPRLACDSNQDIVNLYSDSCVVAGCNDITNTAPASGKSTYQGNNYAEGSMASYVKSGNECESSTGFINYPYKIPYKYNDIATLSYQETTGSTVMDIDNNNDIIDGGTAPIRSCYIITDDTIDNNDDDTTEWQYPDNPCINKCIGAKTFRESFGSSTDNDSINDITSGIEYERKVSQDVITINQNLIATPPKIIKYSGSSGSSIEIKNHRDKLFITYPSKVVQSSQSNNKTRIVLNRSKFQGEKIDTSRVPSAISVVNRENVGVTTHKVSTNKDIKIEWNDATFDGTQYAYFDPEDTDDPDPNKPQPFHCYNSSGNLVHSVNNKHCDFYAENCSDKNGDKRAGCGLINISNDFNDLPEGYFKAGRVDGRFLLARKCNDNGIWSKIGSGGTNHDPSNAKNAATPLVLAKGKFDKEGNEYKKKFDFSGVTPEYTEEGDLLVSKYYNNISGNSLNFNFTNSFNPKTKEVIENNGDYSMASLDDNDKKYSIKLAKFGVPDAIDTLSLFDIDQNIKPIQNYQITIGKNDFNIGNADAESYKLCTKDRIQNRIKYDDVRNRIIVSNDVGESNSNSVISEGDIFIVRDTNTLEIKTYPVTGEKMIHNEISSFPDLATAEIDSDDTTTLSNKIEEDFYLKGQSIEYNYCREGWDNYQIDSSYPTATCEDDGQWIINGNDNCKKRCTVDNMAFERRVNDDGGDHQQTTKLNITGVMKHEEFFDFIFIVQRDRHNHEIRGKYICDNGNLNDQSSVHHRGEDGNICKINGYNYEYNMGGANTSDHIDNDTYRFYNYMRPDTISYQNIGCYYDNNEDCDWMGDRDDYGQWYYNIDCQRNENGFKTSMPRQ